MGHRVSTKHGKYDKFIKNVKNSSGIYGITINDWIVYVGKAKKMKKRVRRHMRNVLNEHQRAKYVLLHDAIKHKQRIKCVVLKECAVKDLKDEEDAILESYYLPLNTQVSKSSPKPDDIDYADLICNIDKCLRWSSQLQMILNKTIDKFQN